MSEPWQIGDWALLQPAWLLPALALLLAARCLPSPLVNNGWRQVLSARVFDYLRARERVHVRHWNHSLLLASLVAMCLAQPAQRSASDETWRHTTGWIAVADISRSMTLDDVLPTRLAAMRQALQSLSEHAAARPLALIIYAGDAFLVSLPAFDHTLFTEQAAWLEHGLIPVEGSNLARALSLANSIIQESQYIGARVVVLSDSGGVSSHAIEAAEFLHDGGHRLDMLLFGANRPLGKRATPRIETFADADASSEWKQAGDAATIDRQAALRLTSAGGGRLVQSDAFGRVDLDALALDQAASKLARQTLQGLMWQPQSHWLLLLGVPLLLRLRGELG